MTPAAAEKGTVLQKPREVSDAASFLRNLGADHLLCSIDPQSGVIRSQRGDTTTVITWAESQNEKGRNIYYHLNKVRAGVNEKASGSDITEIRGLPDDLDWGWKHHSGSYPTRLLELGNQHLQRRVSDTPPSLTVFTGGGFQNLYLFPTALEATADVIRRVEALSRRFVAERGGDMVGTPEHLLRLPGFINYPNKNKAEAGQPRCRRR